MEDTYTNYLLRNNTHKTASNGPSIPIKIPPILKSFCSSNPVLYTIALGGVDTGRNNAVEVARPIAKATCDSKPTRIAMPNGINTVAVAELLMMFEKIIVA